jgi:cyclopropane-fatty-acyl-phospholipid synthase
MWELYLTGCELSFRLQAMMVFQIQMSRRIATVPLTRDYIFQAERNLGDPESARPLTRADAA